MTEVTANVNVETVNKIVVSFIPTHKLGTSDISVAIAASDEDMICSTWKRINHKKENLMNNKKFVESFSYLIPINNRLVVLSFRDGSSALYYCLNNSLIFKNVE